MANSKNQPDDHGVAEILDRFDESLRLALGHLRKLHDRVARSRKNLSAHSGTTEVSKLAEDLRGLAEVPTCPSVAGLIEELKQRIGQIRGSLQDTFREDVRRVAEEEHLPFRMSGDAYGLGPFLLEVNAARESASLSYATYPVEKDIPLKGSACVAKAKDWKASIIDEPVDNAKTCSQVEEAIRVAAARKGRALRGDVRVELPLVFRELEFIRRPQVSAGRSKAVGYTLPRFVVELSRVIQSEENVDSRKLRLETAVIENTKDSRKSIFIPKDLNCGFGEGTYYQALVLHGE
jgi:hypothetical protein